MTKVQVHDLNRIIYSLTLVPLMEAGLVGHYLFTYQNLLKRAKINLTVGYIIV